MKKNGRRTMFLMESRWKPNFWVRSKKMSSISSLDMGMPLSADQAGYGSLEPTPGSANGEMLGILACESTEGT